MSFSQSGSTARLETSPGDVGVEAPDKEDSHGGSAQRLLGEPEVGAVSSTEDVAQDKV